MLYCFPGLIRTREKVKKKVVYEVRIFFFIECNTHRLVFHLHLKWSITELYNFLCNDIDVSFTFVEDDNILEHHVGCVEGSLIDFAIEWISER